MISIRDRRLPLSKQDGYVDNRDRQDETGGTGGNGFFDDSGIVPIGNANQVI